MRMRTNSQVAEVIDTSKAFVENVVTNSHRLSRRAVRDWNSVLKDSLGLYMAVLAAADSGHMVLRAFPRAARVAKFVLRLQAAYRIGPLRGRKRARIHARMAWELRDLCDDLGAGILKLGQFLSCRPDLLPPAYIEALAPLCKDAPVAPLEEIIETLESELGKSVDEVFASIDPEPLGTGSLAQVHRAVTTDGEEVAVKVQFEDVAELVRIDMTLLKAVTHMFPGLLPEKLTAHVVEEFSRSLLRELDFAAEGSSATRFRELCADDDGIRVPRVIDGLSTERVLTMELCPGEPLVERLPKASAEERTAILERWFDSFLRQVFEFGVVHADPHPGNFLVGENGQLTILDFGCVAEVDDATRRGYRDIVRGVVTGNREATSQALVALGFHAEGGDEALAGVAEQLLAGLRSPEAMAELRKDPHKAMEEMLAEFRAAGDIEIPAHFVLIVRVIGTIAGLLIEYGENVDLWGIAQKHVLRPA